MYVINSYAFLYSVCFAIPASRPKCFQLASPVTVTFDHKIQWRHQKPGLKNKAAYHLR